MRKEIIVRMQLKSEKCQSKAMKVAATVRGVQSVTLVGGDKNLLLVIGEGVDTNKLTKKLKKKVGHAEIVELRTLGVEISLLHGNKQMITQSPYHWHPTPSSYHYHYSPIAPRDYTSSGYSRVVARNHPVNYSPMVERHDYHPMDHSTKVVRHEYPRDCNSCPIL